MPLDGAFALLGDQKYVSLTTFRKSGEPVSTAVWVGSDGQALVVTTSETSGKVKRIRNNQHVEVRPCNRRGHITDGTESVAGEARLITDDKDRKRLTEAIRRKYGFEFRVVMGIERMTRSGRRARVIIAIRPA